MFEKKNYITSGMSENLFQLVRIEKYPHRKQALVGMSIPSR